MLKKTLVVVISLVVGLAGYSFVSRRHGADSTTSEGVREGSSSAISPGNGAVAIEEIVPELGEELYSENWLDDGGQTMLIDYLDGDSRSLVDAQKSRAESPRKGIESVLGKLDQIRDDSLVSIKKRRFLLTRLACLYMNLGEFAEADRRFLEVQATYLPGSPRYANYEAARGVAALRGGEVENCVACQNEASCVFPLAIAAVHQKKSGSRKAIEHFTKYLDQRPEDMGIRWLLNIAYMTLGEYPDRVPEKWLIKLDAFRSQVEVGRFTNVAARVGVDALGPKYGGGSAFDDFNNDGLLDIVVSTENPSEGGSILINKGDGTFVDRSAGSGLDRQTGALNMKHVDYDNDGNLDVLFLRGAWEKSQRLSLMRNKGDGTFEDVTIAAGLDRPIATASAGWADYDNDGFVDLYLAGETKASDNPNKLYDIVDLPNSSRLYHNNGDGTFTDVAESAGVKNNHFGKGVAWGDYDGDEYMDLFVSNMDAHSRLFHNNGDGTFEEVGGKLGVTGPWAAFACWFWDYDCDGDLDLFVNAYNADLQKNVENMLGKEPRASTPKLYRNDRENGFVDVSREAGLDRIIMAMGCNYGDIDNDGYLDIYEGTGMPMYSYLVPNVMLKNDRGLRFLDATTSSGTGHLQKGHGVSFGDWNNDGYADLFVRAGGATRGDQANAVLFQNPGGTNHWIYVKLIGKKTNRAAIGAVVKATLPDEPVRPSPNIRYRVVSAGSSWGGNGFPMTIGLGASNKIDKLEIFWPASKTTQTFQDVKVDQAITIDEFADTYRTVDRRPIAVPDAK
jgi:tetratricopeptide (TPR) repeat protein